MIGSYPKTAVSGGGRSLRSIRLAQMISRSAGGGIISNSLRASSSAKMKSPSSFRDFVSSSMNRLAASSSSVGSSRPVSRRSSTQGWIGSLAIPRYFPGICSGGMGKTSLFRVCRSCSIVARYSRHIRSKVFTTRKPAVTSKLHLVIASRRSNLAHFSASKIGQE